VLPRRPAAWPPRNARPRSHAAHRSGARGRRARDQGHRERSHRGRACRHPQSAPAPGATKRRRRTREERRGRTRFDDPLSPLHAYHRASSGQTHGPVVRTAFSVVICLCSGERRAGEPHAPLASLPRPATDE
jgi:hypothetical protein